MSIGVGFRRYCASSWNQMRRRHHSFVPFLSSFTTTTTSRDNENPSRRLPPPVRVCFTESAGRGVFATRKIGAGDLIHNAEPLVSHPSLSVLTTICYFCLRKLKLESGEASSETQRVRFCSDECVRHSKGFFGVEKQFDWSEFNDYCRTQGLKYPLLVKRLACLVVSGVTSGDSLDILQPASLQPEMILKMEEEFCLLRSIFLRTGVKDEKLQFLTKQWYTGVLARIRINTFRVELIGGLYDDLLLSAAASLDAEAAVGNALYMLPSFYNHDCDPNVHILWIDNVTARLKALCDIEAGEELRICYIDASLDCSARKALLFKGFGFECKCLRCTSGD